ncbi:MAG TPA: class I SAM-dependent methyltransferase [Mycobacteriales bacterium]|nr:class I SAM-dependent methyltransferase [Mycobacteriales bacterium]
MPQPARGSASSNTATWTLDAGPPASRCAWCDAELPSGALSLPGRIVCAECGTATTSPVPTDDQLETAYGPWYRPDSGRFGGIGDAVLKRTRATLAGRIDRIAPAGPVLDVGAGDGTLVRALLARGRDAVGLERHATGEHMRDDDLDSIGGTWSAIVFWHSLEHLRQPRASLARAAELLKPGGVVILALPNSSSMQANAFGDRWLALDLPRHLVHVPSSTALRTLEEIGLHPTRVSHLRGGQAAFGWLDGLVGSLPGHPSLYDAIRSSDARSQQMSSGRRAATLAAAAVAFPVALVAAGVEVARRRGGSLYAEARK